MTEAVQTLDRPRGAGQPGYIPTLDGWRAIAVLMVIGAHCETMLRNSGIGMGRKLADVLTHSGVGVDIFFALSGFLIAGQLIDEKAGTGGISFGRFYLRRIFRILPAMFAYLAFVAVLGLAGLLPDFRWQELVAAATFTHNYFPRGSWYTGHFWSLAIEEHFYLFVPLLILLTGRRLRIGLLITLIIACIIVRGIEFGHPEIDSVQFRTENRLDGLLWGAMLAELFRTTSLREWTRARMRGWMLIPLLVLLAGLMVLFPSGAARRAIVAFGIPFFIGYTVLHPESPLGRMLERKPVRIVGRLSYSLYLWQMAFLVLGPRPLGPLQGFPLALIMPFACATLSYTFVEKPLIRVGHRIAKRPTATIAAQ